MSDRDSSSEESSDESEVELAGSTVRRSRFSDEEEGSEVLDSWDAAEDSGAEQAKAKKVAELKQKNEAEIQSRKKSKSQKIEERRAAAKNVQEDDDTPSEEDDPAVTRLRARQREQEADLAHAEDLMGSIGLNKTRANTTSVVPIGGTAPDETVNLSQLPVFNPVSRDQFNALRDTLVHLITANSSRPHYPLFLQDFIKQSARDLPSDQLKKISSSLASLSNERLKEEKAAEKGGKKSKPATSKAKLVASKDVGMRADTTSYEDLGDDDFM